MARVLVVDDERSLRRTFALFLRDDGHEVEAAEDVDEALSMLEQGRFDVVVSDIILPRRSGVSLMEEVVRRWPEIKVILVTGEPTVETAASAVRSGAYDYISKPVSSAKIREIVSAAAQAKVVQDDTRQQISARERRQAELSDLVEQRTAEVQHTRRELASTQERLGRIAANIPGVLMQFERKRCGEIDFTFLGANALDALGVRPEAVLADPELFFGRVHADDLSSLYDSLAESATPPLKAWTWEGRFRGANGEQRWIQARSRPAERERGDTLWDGILFDTSERRELQAKLMLTDRLASIGTLAAGVAHEINNPLTYVLGNLYLLTKRTEATLGESSDPRARDSLCSTDTLQLLGETMEGAHRVRDIARDLNTFSRSSAEVSNIDLHEVLDSSLRMATSQVRDRAQLVRDYGTPPSVRANPSRLGQVFLNLIVNAAQAIAPGEVETNTIQIQTRRGDDGWAEVRVSDTGSGIPADLLDRIFEPFVTMKAVGVGTGLGLYICRDIVGELDGIITVRSSPEGSVFTVRLPAG